VGFFLKNKTVSTLSWTSLSQRISGCSILFFIQWEQGYSVLYIVFFFILPSFVLLALYLIPAEEEISAQKNFMIKSVETFNTTVLPWPSWLNVLNTNAFL
jgi:hypothetical protein